MWCSSYPNELCGENLMPTYEIKTTETVYASYLVTAESAEEAEEQFGWGIYDKHHQLDACVDEIRSIEKVE